MHDYETYARILGEAEGTTVETLRVLGALLGAPEAEAESSRAWAARRLDVPKTAMAAIEHTTSATGIAILGHVLGQEIAAHGDAVEIGGDDDGGPPTWAPLQLGTGRELTVPARLIAHFPADTISSAPMCISVDNETWTREIRIYVDSGDRGAAQDVMSQLLARVRSEHNPYRGQVLEATVDDGTMRLSVSPSMTAPRDSLVLPDDLWREVDVFVGAATHQRELMRDLGLGTTRGLLLAGPPGTGKTHLSRVLAGEFVGPFTVIFADATTMRHHIRDLYQEADTFGPLVVVLEDIDLIVGHRDHSADTDSLADFLAALDGMRQLQDVYTVATTNNAAAIDPAAQRTARFDTILTLPKPGSDERAAILKRYLSPLGLKLDVARVAADLEGSTGSDLREVVRRAILEHGTQLNVEQLAEVATSGRWQPQVSTGHYL